MDFQDQSEFHDSPTHSIQNTQNRLIASQFHTEGEEMSQNAKHQDILAEMISPSNTPKMINIENGPNLALK